MRQKAAEDQKGGEREGAVGGGEGEGRQDRISLKV